MKHKRTKEEKKELRRQKQEARKIALRLPVITERTDFSVDWITDKDPEGPPWDTSSDDYRPSINIGSTSTV